MCPRDIDDDAYYSDQYVSDKAAVAQYDKDQAAKAIKDAEIRKAREKRSAENAIKKKAAEDAKKLAQDKRKAEQYLKEDKAKSEAKHSAAYNAFLESGKGLGDVYSQLGSKIQDYGTQEKTLMDMLGDESNPLYQLTTGDRTASGQLASAIGQQMGQVEEQTMADLVSRGLAGGASGVAQRNLGGVALQKNQALSQMMQGIQNQRIQRAQDTINAKMKATAEARNALIGQQQNIGQQQSSFNNAALQGMGLDVSALNALTGQYQAQMGGAKDVYGANKDVTNLSYDMFAGNQREQMERDKMSMSDAQFQQTYGLNKQQFDLDKQKYDDSQKFDWGKFAANAAGAGLGFAAGGPLGAALGGKVTDSIFGAGTVDQYGMGSNSNKKGL